MSRLVKTRTYTALLKDIAKLYSHARKTLVESYWQIGRCIVEQKQQGDSKAEYGIRLLEQLSEGLTKQLGSGFSRSNLRNMRRFYLNNRIHQPAGELNWSQHVELLPVTNKADKRRLEHQIVSKKLSRRQIRQAVRQIDKDKESPAQETIPAILPPPCREQPLQCFGLIAPDRVACAKGAAMVDCGFNIWREIDRKDSKAHGDPSYTYPARIESVIDGDTLWVIVHCGDGILTRQKLRLHLIDTPERGTPAGDKATRFVKRVRRKTPDIVICTHHYDKYARYRADALHVALATAGSDDVIVSWNFKHVVNLGKIRLFNAVNLEQGYGLIEIRTPKEVLINE